MGNGHLTRPVRSSTLNQIRESQLSVIPPLDRSMQVNESEPAIQSLFSLGKSREAHPLLVGPRRDLCPERGHFHPILEVIPPSCNRFNSWLLLFQWYLSVFPMNPKDSTYNLTMSGYVSLVIEEVEETLPATLGRSGRLHALWMVGVPFSSSVFKSVKRGIECILLLQPRSLSTMSVPENQGLDNAQPSQIIR